MWTLFFLSIGILTFGLFNLLGLSVGLFKNQLIYFLIGIPIFFMVKKLGIQFFRVNATILYWIFIALIIITYVIGLEVKGSRRWIDFYFFSFQSSEFFKIFFMIFMADLFAKNRFVLKEMGFLLKSIGYFLLPAFLVFKQPDLGNAIVYTSIYVGMLFFSGVPKKNILKICLIGLLFIPIGWFTLHDYQRARILTFMNPHTDQGGSSYNMIQAIVTVGSGKFLGRGLGHGTQSGLFFLPENHTDFAFSSLVEQFGFMGGFTLIGMYLATAVTVVRRIVTVQREKHEDSKFRFLFVIGFFSYFITQLFINIGMNLGLMPITGITLPLISYGGSSLLTWFIAIALIP
jgi:rod shape determining protein RodA